MMGHLSRARIILQCKANFNAKCIGMTASVKEIYRERNILRPVQLGKSNLYVSTGFFIILTTIQISQHSGRLHIITTTRYINTKQVEPPRATFPFCSHFRHLLSLYLARIMPNNCINSRLG